MPRTQPGQRGAEDLEDLSYPGISQKNLPLNPQAQRQTRQQTKQWVKQELENFTPVFKHKTFTDTKVSIFKYPVYKRDIVSRYFPSIHLPYFLNFFAEHDPPSRSYECFGCADAASIKYAIRNIPWDTLFDASKALCTSVTDYFCTSFVRHHPFVPPYFPRLTNSFVGNPFHEALITHTMATEPLGKFVCHLSTLGVKVRKATAKELSNPNFLDQRTPDACVSLLKDLGPPSVIAPSPSLDAASFASLFKRYDSQMGEPYLNIYRYENLSHCLGYYNKHFYTDPRYSTGIKVLENLTKPLKNSMRLEFSLSGLSTTPRPTFVDESYFPSPLFITIRLMNDTMTLCDGEGYHKTNSPCYFYQIPLMISPYLYTPSNTSFVEKIQPDTSTLFDTHLLFKAVARKLRQAFLSTTSDYLIKRSRRRTRNTSPKTSASLKQSLLNFLCRAVFYYPDQVSNSHQNVITSSLKRFKQLKIAKGLPLSSLTFARAITLIPGEDAKIYCIPVTKHFNPDVCDEQFNFISSNGAKDSLFTDLHYKNFLFHGVFYAKTSLTDRAKVIAYDIRYGQIVTIQQVKRVGDPIPVPFHEKPYTPQQLQPDAFLRFLSSTKTDPESKITEASFRHQHSG